MCQLCFHCNAKRHKIIKIFIADIIITAATTQLLLSATDMAVAASAAFQWVDGWMDEWMDGGTLTWGRTHTMLGFVVSDYKAVMFNISIERTSHASSNCSRRNG